MPCSLLLTLGLQTDHSRKGIVIQGCSRGAGVQRSNPKGPAALGFHVRVKKSFVGITIRGKNKISDHPHPIYPSHADDAPASDTSPRFSNDEPCPASLAAARLAAW